MALIKALCSVMVLVSIFNLVAVRANECEGDALFAAADIFDSLSAMREECTGSLLGWNRTSCPAECKSWLNGITLAEYPDCTVSGVHYGTFFSAAAESAMKRCKYSTACSSYQMVTAAGNIAELSTLQVDCALAIQRKSYECPKSCDLWFSRVNATSLPDCTVNGVYYSEYFKDLTSVAKEECMNITKSLSCNTNEAQASNATLDFLNASRIICEQKLSESPKACPNDCESWFEKVQSSAFPDCLVQGKNYSKVVSVAVKSVKETCADISGSAKLEHTHSKLLLASSLLWIFTIACQQMLDWLI